MNGRFATGDRRFDSRDRFFDRFTVALAVLDGDPPITPAVNAAEGMRTAILGHMGLAVASEWMFAPELANGTVQAVLTDWTLPPIDLWAVFPFGRMATAKARAFVAFAEHLLNGRKSRGDPVCLRRNRNSGYSSPTATGRYRRNRVYASPMRENIGSDAAVSPDCSGRGTASKPTC